MALSSDIRAVYRAVFNFHDRWQHLPTAPVEEWQRAAQELPAIAATPLAQGLLMALWEEWGRQRKEVVQHEQQA